MASKIAVSIVVLLSCSPARSEQPLNERDAVLNALSLSYGQAFDRDSSFALKADYILRPDFSADGLLIEVSIQPKHGRDPYSSTHLSKAEFESILANINSIKPVGAFEEDDGAIVSGGRARRSQRYQSAYPSSRYAGIANKLLHIPQIANCGTDWMTPLPEVCAGVGPNSTAH